MSPVSHFNLDRFVTVDSILDQLCRERARHAARMHDEHFLSRIGRSASGWHQERAAILDLFPPRSRWIRPPLGRRRQDPRLVETESILRRTTRVLRQRNEGIDQPWLNAQAALIDRVRLNVLSSPCLPVIGRPRIVPVRKRPNSDAYRLIVNYDLEDKIAINATATYLRRLFDGIFVDSSYAFRSPGNGPVPTHHDAFDRIIRFWKETQKEPSQEVWVAECDIQGFFDCIDHNLILEKLDQLSGDALLRGPGPVDSRARDALKAYLRTYTYEAARKEALSKVEGSANIKDYFLPLAGLGRDPAIHRVGVPQGGSLSCFIANLVLHGADCEVLRCLERSGSRHLYLRYCDDIVILADSKVAVAEALGVYQAALAKMCLPVHAVVQRPYGKEFWDAKSKGPYRWCRPVGPDDIPWLAYVGYQLRYDGKIRIRPQSLHGEFAKQSAFTSRVIGRVKKGGKLRCTSGSAKQRLARRLVARAIGRAPDSRLYPEDLSNSWSGGFRCIRSEALPSEQPVVVRQLRALDRHMKKCVVRGRRRFDQSLAPPPVDESEESRGGLRYRGKPRSYAGQLDNPKLKE